MSNNEKKPSEENKGSKDSSKKPKTRMQKIRENKALFSVLFLIILIAFAALVIGLFSFINNLTSPSDQSTDTEETSENSDSDSESENQDNEGENESENNEDGGTTDQDTDQTEDSDSNDNENDSDSESNNDDTEEDSDNANGDNEESAAAKALKTGHSEAGYNRSVANQQQILQTGLWTATNYQPGDIVDSNYTIQTGDTLWEISEAYYGTGFDWVKIKDANQNTVTRLPNGNWALILPNQTLTLP